MQTISLDQAMEQMAARNAALEEQQRHLEEQHRQEAEQHRQEAEQTKKEMEALRQQMAVFAVSFMCIRYQR